MALNRTPSPVGFDWLREPNRLYRWVETQDTRQAFLLFLPLAILVLVVVIGVLELLTSFANSASSIDPSLYDWARSDFPLATVTVQGNKTLSFHQEHLFLLACLICVAPPLRHNKLAVGTAIAVAVVTHTVLCCPAIYLVATTTHDSSNPEKNAVVITTLFIAVVRAITTPLILIATSLQCGFSQRSTVVCGVSSLVGTVCVLVASVIWLSDFWGIGNSFLLAVRGVVPSLMVFTMLQGNERYVERARKLAQSQFKQHLVAAANQQRIVGYIFHEVRNPINNITLAAELTLDLLAHVTGQTPSPGSTPAQSPRPTMPPPTTPTSQSHSNKLGNEPSNRLSDEDAILINAVVHSSTPAQQSPMIGPATNTSPPLQGQKGPQNPNQSRLHSLVPRNILPRPRKTTSLNLPRTRTPLGPQHEHRRAPDDNSANCAPDLDYLTSSPPMLVTAFSAASAASSEVSVDPEDNVINIQFRHGSPVHVKSRKSTELRRPRRSASVGETHLPVKSTANSGQEQLPVTKSLVIAKDIDSRRNSLEDLLRLTTASIDGQTARKLPAPGLPPPPPPLTPAASIASSVERALTAHLSATGMNGAQARTNGTDPEQRQPAANGSSQNKLQRHRHTRSTMHLRISEQRPFAHVASDVYELVEDIHQSTKAAVRVLNDALNLQKLQSGAFEFVLRPFILEDLLVYTTRVVKPQMRHKQIQMTVMLDDELRGIAVEGDFHRLQQVLTNYLNNAYKFTPISGSVEVHMHFLGFHDVYVEEQPLPQPARQSRASQDQGKRASGHTTDDATGKSRRLSFAMFSTPQSRQASRHMAVEMAGLSVHSLADNANKSKQNSRGGGKIKGGLGLNRALTSSSKSATSLRPPKCVKQVRVRTSVKNTGQGIKEQDRGRIFQPWSQLRAGAQQQEQGSGLGLALCKAFVEKGHKGTVGFECYPTPSSPDAPTVSNSGDTNKSTTEFFFDINFVVCRPAEVRRVSVAGSAARTVPTTSEPTAANIQQRSPFVAHQPKSPLVHAVRMGFSDSTSSIGEVDDEDEKNGSKTRVGADISNNAQTAQTAQPTQPTHPQRRTSQLSAQLFPRQSHASDTMETYAVSKAVPPPTDAETTEPPVNTLNSLSTTTNSMVGDEPTAGADATPLYRVPMVSLASTTTPTQILQPTDTTDEASTPVHKSSRVATLNIPVEQSSPTKSHKVDVLIVEDSAMSRKLLARTLKGLGVSCNQAIDGQEAIEMFETLGVNYFGIVLMDKEMPRVDGFGATRRMREMGFSGPIVGCTGNVMDDQVADFLAAGANHVLGKPVTQGAIASTLQQFGLLETSPRVSGKGRVEE